MSISGSAPPTPDPSRKAEGFLTPEMAILQIRLILELCIKENAHKLPQKLLTLLAEYNSNFPIVNMKLKFMEGEERAFNFDELKEYILLVLIPQLSADQKLILRLDGGLNLIKKLTATANAWPSQDNYEILKAKREKEVYEQEGFYPLSHEKYESQQLKSPVLTFSKQHIPSNNQASVTPAERKHKKNPQKGFG
ncbi:hypothetical protein [Candidatus Berkiella aquae]|uniref:Uncharacterized protein n=1 Tax=Candidatus Berkiella aquae TaxID=295108 RepID=A0A0Q9YYQ9_9GAMM|nr:hypothetical protein [Candidatus Berkiella aquae]MCS5711940.1 hypothetical protein [Candidatus Berkiella aquae]